MPIPAHRIWFGEPFPDKYFNELVHLRELHPDRPVMLWTDKLTQSEKSCRKLHERCKSHNISLCNIRDYPDLLNFDLIEEELAKSKARPSHKKVHYVRASDIARISILYLLAGIYTDTDSKMLAPFPVLNPKHGIYIKQTRHLNKNVYSNKLEDPSHPYYFKNVHYDFIATDKPNNPYLKLCADIIRLDFETHRKSQYNDWEKTDANSVLLLGTIHLTGTALKWALNYAYQHDDLQFNHPDEVVFDIESIMETGSDKSWLEDFEITEDNVMRKFKKGQRIERKLLTPWIEELKQARLQRFPIHQPPGKLPLDNPIKPDWDDFKYFDFRYPSDEKIDSEEFLKYLSRKKQADTSTRYILESMKINKLSIPVEPLELPTFDFKIPAHHPDYSQLMINLVTRERLSELYAEKGGSLWQQFRLFVCNRDKSTDEIIKILEKRAQERPDGASSMTLAAINRQ